MNGRAPLRGAAALREQGPTLRTPPRLVNGRATSAASRSETRPFPLRGAAALREQGPTLRMRLRLVPARPGQEYEYEYEYEYE